MAKNLIKDKVMEMVNRQLHSLEKTELHWSYHTISFYGPLAAGSAMVELRDIKASETHILITMPNGTRQFKVKVTEMY